MHPPNRIAWRPLLGETNESVTGHTPTRQAINFENLLVMQHKKTPAIAYSTTEPLVPYSLEIQPYPAPTAS